MAAQPTARGRLRIGDDWNAITIIALSQDNPLKAVAEFVENSIDAGARSVTITRGRERGEHYLEITDDGRGVPRDADGVPDFKYVATHICDSITPRWNISSAPFDHSRSGSPSSSRNASVPKKSKVRATRYARFSARSEKPCSPCLPRITSGST